MPAFAPPDLHGAQRPVGARAGASAAGARYRDEALALLAREPLVSPAFFYRIHPAKLAGGGRIDTGGATLYAPALAEAPGELTAVAVAVCTVGPALQRRVFELFSTRRRSLALALDNLASEQLFRLADRATAAIGRDARRCGLAMGMEISPGDPGMPLDQQAAVVALAGSSRDTIAVTAAGVLAPIQSLSMIVALGRNMQRRCASARCAACPSRERCTAN